ncbi:homing endonuclease, partial [Cladochytrium replicatum]
GDGYAEKLGVINGGTRITFGQENSNQHYLFWLHDYLASRGYTSTIKPRLLNTISENSKICYSCCFHTYSFSSFNFLHSNFYPNYIKIPRDLDIYFTPLSLAVLIMDDGSKTTSGLRLCLQAFTYEDL